MGESCWGQRGEFLIWALQQVPFPREQKQAPAEKSPETTATNGGSGP